MMINLTIQTLIFEAGKSMKTVLVNFTDSSKDIESDIWKEVEPYCFKEVNNIIIFYAVDSKTKEFLGLNLNQINDIIITDNAFTTDKRRELPSALFNLID